MTVLLEPMPSAPVVACNVWVGVGSADETPEQAGLAHVHEHMLFKGTDTRQVGEIARDVEASGGHINAFTSFDQTCYYVVMSSRFFERGLDILSDAIFHSSFDADELHRELEVIQEEIKRGEDNPNRVASRMLFETAFTTHPYRLPVIGTSESVDSFDRDDVLHFFQTHYVPQNMTLILAGDFDVDEAKERIDHYFGRAEDVDYTPVTRPSEPPQDSPRATTDSRDIQQNHLRLAFHIPHILHEDIPALDLLSILLGYGDAAHLDKTLRRDEELFRRVFASAYTPKEPGLLVLGGDFQRADDHRPTTLLKRLLEESFRWRHETFDPDDIARAKTLLESQEIYSKQTIEGMAMKIGHYHMLTGDDAYEQQYYRALRAVTADDIQRVARRYLRADNTTAILLQPDDEAAVTVDDLLTTIGAVEESLTPEAPAVHTSNAASEPQRIQIDGGPTLIVQHDPSVEIFSLRAMQLGGLRHETPDTAGLHKLLAQTITAGTDERDALQIAGEVESMAAKLDGHSGRNTFGLAMTGLTRFFDPCFEIFSDCLLGATIPDDEFQRERRLQRQQQIARKDRLSAVNFDQFCAHFFGDHPFSLPSLGTEDSLDGLSADLARQALGRRQRGQDWALAAVGDLPIDQVILRVEEFMAQPTDVDPYVDQPFPIDPPEGPQLVTGDMDREQAHIMVGFPAPPAGTDDTYALSALYSVLAGQGGRLFYELRDRQSLAYSVYAQRVLGVEASTFALCIATSPDKIERAINGIRQQVQLLHDEGITEAELTRARRHLIGNHDIGLQRTASRAMSFALDEAYGNDFDRCLAFGDRISDVTVDDVHQYIDRWLPPQRFLASVIKPSDTEIDADALGLHRLSSE